MKTATITKYKCNICGKSFDMDNIIWKSKTSLYCEKCYSDLLSKTMKAGRNKKCQEP